MVSKKTGNYHYLPSGIRNNVGFNEALYQNDQTYANYYNQLIAVCLSLFKWEGLPEQIDPRFVEMNLLFKGYLIYFQDDAMGDMFLPGVISGYDLYKNPTKMKINETTDEIHYSKELTDQDAVVMFNTYLREPILPVIEMYARRLYEITRTQDINVKGQKTPVLIKAKESQLLTLKQIYQKYDGNEPVIFGDNELLDDQQFTVLKTDAPYVSDKLQELKHSIWNEFYTWVGLNNSNQEKAERMLVDEVNANNDQVQTMKDFMLNARRSACDKINQKFGTNLSVSYNVDLLKEEQSNNIETEEGDDHE